MSKFAIFLVVNYRVREFKALRWVDSSLKSNYISIPRSDKHLRFLKRYKHSRGLRTDSNIMSSCSYVGSKVSVKLSSKLNKYWVLSFFNEFNPLKKLK